MKSNENTRNAQAELPDEQHSVAREVGRLPKSIAGYKCVDMSMTGMTLRPDANYQSYEGLINELDSIWYAGEIKGLALKFYIGDIMNGGRDVFGEMHTQAISENTHWKPSYLSQICWVCSKIPQENRSLKLNSWGFHHKIAGLSVDDQAYYKAMAEELKESGNMHWQDAVKKAISEDKRIKALSKIPEEERAYWNEVIDKLNPTITRLNRWLNGDEVRPDIPVSAGEFIARSVQTLSEHLEISKVVSDNIAGMMFDMAEQIEKGKVLV